MLGREIKQSDFIQLLKDNPDKKATSSKLVKKAERIARRIMIG